MARNLDERVGPLPFPPASKTATTLTNTAPDSANFTKQVSRHAGGTFSESDFPFSDDDAGDSLSKVKIVTLPGTDRDRNNLRQGELRLDGVAVTAGQVVPVDDLGKLKYEPQPDGFRLKIASSFTFKVIDQAEGESPTYTVTLEQIPDIVLSLSPDSITESSTPSSGGRVTVTATLTGPTRTTETVVPQIRIDIAHDARENSDYTVNTKHQELRIEAGQKGASLTFEFTGIADSLVEGDEKIRFDPDWAINGVVPRDSVTELVRSVDLTLKDNDRAVVSITAPPGEVEEGEDAVFTVSLSRGIHDPLSVAWTASSDTASADDFVGSSGTVTFPAGSPDNATQTIAIPVTDDLDPESTESFSVTLGAITGEAASQVSIESGKGTATADIAENDVVTVSISGDARVEEGESATYTIELDSDKSTEDITVDYVTTDKTASAGTDYTSASGTVTIAAGETSATVTVATADNEDDEPNRYFEFRMSNPQGGGGPLPMLDTTQFVQTTIVDNDGDPSSIVLTVDKTSFGEADVAGTVNVTATLEGGTLTTDATVEVTLGGSATNGSSGDYTATTLGNITITGGESSGTGSFTVTPVNDEVVEGDETILVQGASAGMDVTPATITIADDDTATLGITGPSGLISEGENAEFTVTLSHAVASQVVVAWSAGSTAQAPATADDYSPDSGSVIFPAGSAAGATKTITMVIADDGAEEEEETFTVTLGSVSGDLASKVSVDSAKSSADASIASGQVVTVTLLGPRAFAHENSTDYAVYHVLLSGPVNADIQVDVATADGTATGCISAVNSCTGDQTGDYGRVSKTLTIGPSNDTEQNVRKLGVTWQSVFVSFTDYPRSDPDETFTISLSNLRGGGTTPVMLGNSSVTTTIKSTPLAFSVSGPEFVDEGTRARFVVTRNVDLVADMGAGVSYATSDGTAEAGTDYTAASGTLEMPIPTGDSVPTVEEIQRRYSDWEVLVPVTADNVDESDETFSLTLSNPQTYYSGQSNITAAALGTPTATTTIRDRAMMVSVGGPETVVEGGYADFTVSLSRAPTANLTVNYQTYSALAPARLATSGDDFTPQSGTLTFVPGETSKRVRVPVLTDAITEPIEYFRLLIASPSGGGGLTPSLGASIATTGIVDAAGPLLGATLTVTPDSSVDEGDGAATDFTVKVDLDCCTTFDDPMTVRINFTGTATDDYTPVAGTLTIPASTATGSTTLKITPVEDEVVEGDEVIVVGGSVPGFVIFPDTIDLTDNDTATVGITGPDEVEEGSTAEFTVTLSAEIARELTVPWSAPLDTDTATAADLGATAGILTFDAGSAAGATQTISIPIAEDNLPEAAETFTVTLGPLGGHLADSVSLDPGAASATIARDEDFAHITLSFDPEYVQEGESEALFTLTATRDGTVGDHTVDWSVQAPQTATNGTDFTRPGRGVCRGSRNNDYYTLVHPSDVRIAPGESSASTTVTYRICSDDLDEPNETISYTAVVPGATVTPAVLTIGDPEAITLSVSPGAIAEDAGATEVTVTATMSAARGTDTVVSITLGGTATDPTDYTATTLSSITIPKGDASADGTVTITPVLDTETEGDETITVSGTSGARPVSAADITITDNDTIAEAVNISGPDIVMERNAAVYTISLSPAGATVLALI